MWDSFIRDNLNYLKDIAYVEFTSNVSITATTEGTAQTIVDSGAITYEAAPIVVEFQSADVVASGGGSLFILLQDGATVLGRMASYPANGRSPLFVMRRFSPTAASHTFKVTAHNSAAGTSTVTAGAGGAGTTMPGFIRVRGIPT
jgi:hypothetical protein